MNVFVLAWRNVWRNSRRSIITITAMALALWTELIYSGLIAGLMHDMTDDVTAAEMGDIQVFKPGYLERPSLHEVLPGAAETTDRLNKAGYPASARLAAGAFAASGELSAGVSLVGLNPVQDGTVLSVGEKVEAGQWLDPADAHGVVVGHGLARTLALAPGSELLVLSQAADGSIANDLYTVRGVLGSVASATDRSTVFLVEPAFRDLFALPSGAHRIIVRAPVGGDLTAAAAAVSALAPGAEVKTWKQLNPFMAQMLDAVQVQMTVIYFVLYLAVAILVLNAMLMAVFERIREFGVLKAIGYGPGQVAMMMIAEGMFQALVAALVGTAAAVPVMFYLQTTGLDVARIGGVSMMGMSMPTLWRGVYTLETTRVPVVMLFAIVFAAVLYPALKAAWIRPVEAMHHS